jgi:hypothetical protein
MKVLRGPGPRPLLLVAPAVVCLALTMAACGGGSPSAGVASPSTTTAVPTAAAASGGPPSASGELVKYASCMRSQGVSSFPDPASLAASGAAKAFKISRSVASSPAFQAAQRACAKYAPPNISPPQITTQDQDDYLKAAACMRNHGIVGFPDPVFSGGQVDFPIPHGMNPHSTQFRRAREICAMLIPAGLPYSKAAGNGQ